MSKVDGDPRKVKANRKKALRKLHHAYQAGELTDKQIERAKSLGIRFDDPHGLKPGVNDLASQRPAIAAQWHPEKNGSVRPEDVTTGSGFPAWWRHQMPDGTWHEWPQSVYARVGAAKGCPYCAGTKVLPGFNDLASRYPDLAAQWHSEKNAELKPSDVNCGSPQKVWWICPECGYEWPASVNSRVKGAGCKRCAGQVVLPGETDLVALYPLLSRYWDMDRNEGRTPRDVMPHSNKRVWWRHQMPDGTWHEWQAKVSSVVGRWKEDDPNSISCSVCAGRTVQQGVNDLESQYPGIAAEWDYGQNAPSTPQSVFCRTTKKYGWICKTCGHKWNAAVRSRVKGHGCPKCGTRRSSDSKRKRVVCVETGVLYGSINEATEAAGLKSRASISNALKNGNPAGGYHWRYEEERGPKGD